jgi:hypothetical protein
MESSYDVRIWNIKRYQGSRTTTYYVRWVVAGRELKKPFKTDALADSFRSELVTAARKGEAFEIGSGLPVSTARAGRDLSFYALCCQYADLKWPHVAATTRRTHAEALTAFTAAMLTDERATRTASCSAGRCAGGRSTRPGVTTRLGRQTSARCCGGCSGTPGRCRRWPSRKFSGRSWTP